MRKSATASSVSALLAALALVLPACAAPGDSLEPEFEKAEDADGDGKADSSAIATILDFEFDGELVTDSDWAREQSIRDQLLYTMGHLNHDKSVGRLDRLELSNVTSEPSPGATGGTLIKYHAKMPVAWGAKTNLPTSYTFRLPRDVSSEGQDTFAASYAHDCVDFGAHDVDAGSFWYYYRPARSGCVLAAADIVTIQATALVSTSNTTGRYPEYHKVWEDGALNVVAIFGKYEDGATTSSDAGIDAYNRFVAAARTALPGAITTPASVPSSPGVGSPDVTFVKELPGGKRVQVVALLVDNVRTAGASFDLRYGTLSTRADVIVYNGHAGLGANVRALVRKGRFVAGQYVMVFMNGCDTYAYVDGYLGQQSASLNADDPTGTKYVDIVTNAMPSFFSNMSAASMALVKGLMKHETPTTYEQMFRQVSSTQVVLVTGEHDNVYVPGYDPNGGGGTLPGPWAGLTASGQVNRNAQQRFETPALPAGSYELEITGTGDADLYVRVGTAPSTTSYDCRPYRSGSNETCVVTLATASVVHVMVRGYAASSTFELIGRPQ